MSGNFDGKVAVVLGASAEGGTGWAIAKAFAAQGAKVVVAARRFALLQQLAPTIGALPVACDAASEEQVAALAQAALDAYGRIDIAVNSAGVPVMSLIRDATRDTLQEAIDFNYFGMVYFVKHMAQAMGAREPGNEGSIVLISSMSTTHTLLPHFAYAAAKSATDCLVRYAALEYAPEHIKVNSILAGSIVSDMARESYKIPGWAEAKIKEVPFGRLGTPEDFANATLWLAGPSYVTGLNLQVNGGNQLTRFPYRHEMPAHTSADLLGHR